MIDILNKCHTDPRLINNHYLTILLITLKVQDIHYFFSKSISFTFFAILFFEVSMWSTRFSHPKGTTPKVARVVTSDLYGYNRKEKSLRHVAMVAKFLMTTKRKRHLKNEFALF